MTVKEYNQCVELYSDRVFRFIYKNTRDRDDADDVVQNAFEILWKNHERVEFEKCRSYLFTVAYHNFIDNVRKMKRITRMEEHHEDLMEAPDRSYKGVKEIVDEALSKLPEIQKNVVLLRDYEGYDYAEIGNITGLSESQVKVYIFRARQFLKNYIGAIETVI